MEKFVNMKKEDMMKEEKLTLEEQKINGLLSENFDRSKWPDLKPNYIPPALKAEGITLEQFREEGLKYLKQLFDEHYGTDN